MTLPFTPADEALPILQLPGACTEADAGNELLTGKDVVANLAARHRRVTVAGHKYSFKALLNTSAYSTEVGAAIVGRPVARHLDDGRTLEITRLVTRGHANVASKLLGAAAREAKKRGFSRIVTYTLASESGTSLKAAGFVVDGETKGGSWNVPSRPRTDKHPTEPKTRWVRAWPAKTRKAKTRPVQDALSKSCNPHNAPPAWQAMCYCPPGEWVTFLGAGGLQT